MLNKVVILSDSFKGSISSQAIARLGKSVLEPYLPGKVVGWSIADGGEGTVQFFIDELGFKPVEVESVNAYLKPIRTQFAYLDEVAVFDVASIVGFDVNDHLDIRHVTSYGIGLVLKEIIKRGFKKIYLGLGGSITNDGGSGLLEALGAKFYYEGKDVILHQNPFTKVDMVDTTELSKNLDTVQIVGLSDVKNPLLGEKGATSVFGPQKGATITDQAFLESWMAEYSHLFGIAPDTPGAGAAGGLGFSLLVMGATLLPGIKVMLDYLPIDEIDQDTLVITGEGALDKTSFDGKVVGEIVNLTKEKGNKLAIICGINKYLENLAYPIFPLHQEVTNDYQLTVESDLKEVFQKILKEVITPLMISAKEANALTDALMKLRRDIFVVEQGVDLALEFDGQDDLYRHFEVYFGETVIGGARVKIKGATAVLGRILIHKAYRHLGIGTYLMKELIKSLCSEGVQKFLIHAQTVAIPFYSQLGFVAVGDEFNEDGIMHYQMELIIE